MRSQAIGPAEVQVRLLGLGDAVQPLVQVHERSPKKGDFVERQDLDRKKDAVPFVLLNLLFRKNVRHVVQRV